MRILVVDDEQDLRELFRDLLTRKGHDVVTAMDGVEGVSIFRHAVIPIEGVLSDYNMPRMRGDAMIGEILKLDPGVRVVMASADPPRGLPASVKVLRKPFRNAELVEAFA
jgi:CheY-like chemotaxis protein